MLNSFLLFAYARSTKIGKILRHGCLIAGKKVEKEERGKRGKIKNVTPTIQLANFTPENRHKILASTIII